MSETAITALIQAGSAGLVIIVVVIFLAFMERRDKYFLDAISKIAASLDKLSEEHVALRVYTKGHHESVENMTKMVIDKVNNLPQKEKKAWA